jgi:hypothetical protein
MSSSSSSNKRKLEKQEKVNLNLDGIKETLWLVKLPDFVGEYINNADHNQVVGKLKVRKTMPKPSLGSSTVGSGKQITTTTVELIGAGENIPTEFTLEEKITGDDLRMLAFSEMSKDAGNGNDSSNSNGGYVLHGSVTKSMILRPEGAAYNKLLRERSIKSYQRREIKVETEALVHINNMSHIVNFKPPGASLLKMQAYEADKANRNLEESEEGANHLRLTIFEAFTKTDMIKQADLHAYCSSSPGYSAQRVKDLLEKYAKYHAKGTYKHFWELLPEYRGTKAPPLKQE